MTTSVFRADVLAGRVAFVTGASSGLGRHFAGVLAAHGAEVVISARTGSELVPVVEEIAAAGGRAHAVTLDVRDPASVESGVRAAVAAAGRLDILVNNAGVTVTRPALAMSEDEWRRVVDTNLDGAFRVARAVARTMVEAKSGGVIVNIASVLALRVGKLVAGYVAAKAGFLRLSEALALEWAMHGIRVNAIAPGPVDTAMAKAVHTPEIRKDYHDTIPLNRYGLEEELAEAIFFLCSERSAYLTGQVIAVDGGFDATGIGLPTMRAQRRNL